MPLELKLDYRRNAEGEYVLTVKMEDATLYYGSKLNDPIGLLRRAAPDIALFAFPSEED